MQNITESTRFIKPIRKNSFEQIQIGVREYRGHTFADLRIHYRDDAGEWKPSNKGVTISPATWPEFRAAIDQLEEELERCGLLEREPAEEDAT